MLFAFFLRSALRHCGKRTGAVANTWGGRELASGRGLGVTVSQKQSRNTLPADGDGDGNADGAGEDYNYPHYCAHNYML